MTISASDTPNQVIAPAGTYNLTLLRAARGMGMFVGFFALLSAVVGFADPSKQSWDPLLTFLAAIAFFYPYRLIRSPSIRVGVELFLALGVFRTLRVCYGSALALSRGQYLDRGMIHVLLAYGLPLALLLMTLSNTWAYLVISGRMRRHA